MRSTKAAFNCAVVAAGLISIIGCGGKHHLNQYNFSNKTLAVVFLEPPAPELLHGRDYVSTNDNAITAVMRAGGGAAKEYESRRARARLDSAADQVDLVDLLAVRTTERANRYLGTRAAGSLETADFLIEISMRSFGIDARSNQATYLFTRAEAVLIDRRTGREIWSEDVRGTDRLTPRVTGNVPVSIISAGTLRAVTVRDFQEALEQLTVLTSDLITSELREKLRDVRN